MIYRKPFCSKTKVILDACFIKSKYQENLSTENESVTSLVIVTDQEKENNQQMGGLSKDSFTAVY